MSDERRTDSASKACGEWLAYCLQIGWQRKDLDALEALWWKYHDGYGRLISSSEN